MRIKVTQENLARALNSVSRIASSRGTLPILSNILLKTVGNRLSIAATNLDIAITHFIGSKVTQEGAITIPARLTQDFVASLPSGVIEILLKDNKLHITTEQYQSVINGVSADEYPVMPAITKGQSWSIDAAILKKSIQQVIIAASSDETRPTLTGTYFHTQNGALYIVATDSYRLAEKETIKVNEDINLLIPATALNDLLRVVGDYGGEVTITNDDQQVLFQAGDVELVTRLIDGKYPDYQKLIPKEFANSATLKRADLTNITKVSSLFARESAGSVTINLDNKNNQINIRSIASQLGENTATAPAKIKGDGAITLNSRYILDALHVMVGDEVELSFNGHLEACVLRDPAASDYLHIVMPLKS